MDEFRSLVRDIVRETLNEMLSDPDEGLDLQDGLEDALHHSIKAVNEGAPTLNAPAALALSGGTVHPEPDEGFCPADEVPGGASHQSLDNVSEQLHGRETPPWHRPYGRQSPKRSEWEDMCSGEQCQGVCTVRTICHELPGYSRIGCKCQRESASRS